MEASVQKIECFIAEQFSMEKGLYTICEICPLNKNINLRELKEAFFKVIKTHPNLQSFFKIDEKGKLISHIAMIKQTSSWNSQEILFDMLEPSLIMFNFFIKRKNYKNFEKEKDGEESETE